jgi:hypothetical protein
MRKITRNRSAAAISSHLPTAGSVMERNAFLSLIAVVICPAIMHLS